jgi:hypothetical protein
MYSCWGKVCSEYYIGLNFMLQESLDGETVGAYSRAASNNPDMSALRDIGFVMTTFPGRKLINAIINTNSRLSAKL